MSLSKSTITLEYEQDTLDGREYKVVKLQNRTTPKIGDWLTESQVNRLIQEKNTTVNISPKS